MSDKNTTDAPEPVKAEPVRIPIDEQGNPLPVKSFTDLVQRNSLDGGVGIHKDLPEAGGIAWLDASIQQGENGLVMNLNKFNVTARANTPVQSIRDLLSTLSYLEGLGIEVHLEQTPRSLTPRMADAAKALGGVDKVFPPVKPAQVTQPKPPMSPANAPQPTPQAVPPAQEPQANSEGGGMARIVKVVCKPLAGGKFVLEFHESGHPKYPDYSTYKAGIEPEAALAILNESGYDFDASMLNPVDQVAFNVNCDLQWRYSKATKKDGISHYKNFVRLYPVGAA